MMPETCEPTCTVTTADSWPVAVTICSMVPRSTLATLKVRGSSLAERRMANQVIPAPTRTSGTAALTQRRRLRVI